MSLSSTSTSKTRRMVDEIPQECCCETTRKRRLRRPTVMTEETYPCSDAEDEEEIVSLMALAPSEDTDDDDYGDSSNQPQPFIDVDVDDHSSLEEDSVYHESLDLSLDHLRHKSSNRHLKELLEENQRMLESLVLSSRHKNNPLHPTTTTTTHNHILRSNAANSLQTPAPPASTATTSRSSLTEWLSFEVQHSIPGVAALLLYCLAHASTYELISNLAYELVEREPYDPITDNQTSSSRGSNNNSSMDSASNSKLFTYTIMLLVGCLLARYSGLVWEFVGPRAYQRAKFVYHNRIRGGAKDAQWLRWLQQRRGSEMTLGCLRIVAYYLCYIAIVYFVSRLAALCDQRDVMLANLPSAVYQQQVSAARITLQPQQQQGNNSFRSHNQAEPLYMCPTRDFSPEALFGNHTAAATSATSNMYWDHHPMFCVQEDDNDNNNNNSNGDRIWIFGLEDDQYLYHRLAKNSYEKFFGQDYETALFDSTHQILFYGALAATAIYTLKACLGMSFWAGW